MKQKTIAVLFFMLCAGLLMQCKKEATGLDKELLDRSKATTGFTYYKNDNTIKASSPQSAHNAFFRVRFNAIAQAALTDNGKLPVDSVFPEGSLIVKELYDTQNGALKILAVSEKAISAATWKARSIRCLSWADGLAKAARRRSTAAASAVARRAPRRAG